MRTSKTLDSSSFLQLVVGATLAFAGAVAILKVSNVWTVTEVRYAEYSTLMIWGLLLIIGALRHR